MYFVRLCPSLFLCCWWYGKVGASKHRDEDLEQPTNRVQKERRGKNKIKINKAKLPSQNKKKIPKQTAHTHTHRHTDTHTHTHTHIHRNKWLRGWG